MHAICAWTFASGRDILAVSLVVRLPLRGFPLRALVMRPRLFQMLCKILRFRCVFIRLIVPVAALLLNAAVDSSFGDDEVAQAETEEGQTQPPASFPPLGSEAGNDTPPEIEKPPKSPFGPPPGAKPLSQTEPIWFDLKRNALFIDGRVALREGPPLEMFACPVNTKEHESVVAVYARPRMVHAALLLLGAEVGHPVQFDPYKPAAGTEIDILVMWKDETGRSHKAPAQKWVRSISTKKALTHPWVFAGSGIWKDEETGESGYKADSGDFICVSNFETATLDLPIRSSDAKADLLYEAYTEHIPPRGTPVRLVLMPRAQSMPDVEEAEKDAP